MADVIMSNFIKRLLIVNRGEIARRIMRSAHNMGISTVAVYADGDAGEPFVREADQAIALGGKSSLETYLDQAKILAVARRTGADAVHPGYGFLSENMTFANAVQKAGLIWVGPSADAITQMGDKLSSKRLMTEAGVPTLPSAEVPMGTDTAALAANIGYPLLVKASKGGGGKGMRVVETETALEKPLMAPEGKPGLLLVMTRFSLNGGCLLPGTWRFRCWVIPPVTLYIALNGNVLCNGVIRKL